MKNVCNTRTMGLMGQKRSHHFSVISVNKTDPTSVLLLFGLRVSVVKRERQLNGRSSSQVMEGHRLFLLTSLSKLMKGYLTAADLTKTSTGV